MLSSMNSSRVGNVRASLCQHVSRRGRICVSAHRAHSKPRLTIPRGTRSDGGFDPENAQRDQELLRRENQLWQRMELLLDREAELREQELASANRREAHLQSQVDMLLSILSNNQSDKSLPPGSLKRSSQPQEPPPPRIADVLQSMEQSAANLAHGTFNEDNVGSDTLSAIDQALQEGPAPPANPGSTPTEQFSTNSAEKPSFAEEIQGVVDGVLKRNIDPLEDMQWEDLRVPKRQSNSSTGQATGTPSTTSQPDRPMAPSTPSQQSSASARGGAVPASIADAMMSAAAAASEAGDGPVEVEKAPKDGPPPMLNVGDDDIFWVVALHNALLKGGCYCGEDDEADFYFGAGTQSALMAYQAMNKLPETGIADEATWASFGIRSGADVAPEGDADAAPTNPAEQGMIWQQGDGRAAADSGKNPAEDGLIWQQGDGSAAAAAAASKDPAEEGRIWQQGDKADAGAGGGSFGGLFDGLGVAGDNNEAGSGSDSSGSDRGAPARIQSAKRREKPLYEEWPILREGDGNRAVHTVHVMLQQQGFHPDEEDTKWWMYGPTTLSAITTFQACSGLPESGVCDVATWLALLGKHAKPQDIDLVFSGDSDDEDMEETDGRVYLLGEQRWSKY